MQDGLDGDQILNYIMDEGGGNIQLELVWEGGLIPDTFNDTTMMTGRKVLKEIIKTNQGINVPMEDLLQKRNN
jgi:hypothetical protein